MDKTEGTYFIAIVPPSEILEQIEHVKQTISTKYATKGALRSPAHITLQMPFKWPEKKLALLEEKISQFVLGQSGFAIQLKNFGAFPPRVIYVDIAENEKLQNLQQHLERWLKVHLHIFGANHSHRAFHPHITVAFRDLKKPAFFQAWTAWKDGIFSADFMLKNISLLKHDGKKWQVFADYELNKPLIASSASDII